MKRLALSTAAVLILAATAAAQSGVKVRTRDAGGAAVDRVSIETGVNDAEMLFTNIFVTFDGVGAPPVSAAGQGRIYFDTGTGTFMLSENGGAYVGLIGAGGGITNINGLTAATQTFATGSTNINISSAGSVHTFTWAGQLSAARGGLGLNTSATPTGVGYRWLRSFARARITTQSRSPRSSRKREATVVWRRWALFWDSFP